MVERVANTVMISAADYAALKRQADDSFHAGTLAALDIVYLHDQEVIAAEIVNATDHDGLLKHAIREQYMNLGKLKATIRAQNGRRRRARRVPSPPGRGMK